MASMPRNPTIARVLYLRKAIEMWGRGIGLILDTCEKAHLAAPKIYEDRGFVYTVFMRPTAQEWQGKVCETNGVNREVNDDTNAGTKSDVGGTNKGFCGTNAGTNGTKDGTKDDLNGTNDDGEDGLLLGIIRQEPSLNLADLAVRLAVSRRTIARRIQSMKAQGRIRRVGGPRGTWEVLK